MARHEPPQTNGLSLNDDNLLRRLFDSFPLAIFATDQLGIVRLWTASAEQILGWQSEEILGRPLFEAYSQDAAIADILATGLLDFSRSGIDLEWHRKDGKVLQLKLLTTPLPLPRPDGDMDGVLVVVIDRTETTAARLEYTQLIEREREARIELQAERRFRELLEAAPDAIFEVDREGRIVLLNAVAEKIFGYTRAELLNQPIEILVPGTLQKRHVGHRIDYWSHPVTRPMGSGLDLRACRKDGTTFPVEISLSPVKYEDEFRVTAVVRDITERRKTEDELRSIQERHNRELTTANARLEVRNSEIEEANHLKSEFLASMSHELRTPLHTIIGFAELLGEELKGPLNNEQKRFVDHIHRDSKHLLELINDILDLSKIEAGRLELRLETFDLESILDDVLASIRPQGMAKSMTIETHIIDSIVFEADPVRFKEILYNLLSNAVKFTPEGGEIQVDVMHHNDCAEISVSDTGIGISPQEHSTIFEAFRQVGTTTRGVREGTGLGLAITKQLVELHGGKIWVESTPGQGSRFTFTIPLQRAGKDT